MKTRELEIQDEIIRQLEMRELFPFSVVCSFSLPPGREDGIVAITFYLESDMNEFLEWIDYKNQCDKSGYIVIEKTNTIVLSGLGLINFYTLLI